MRRSIPVITAIALLALGGIAAAASVLVYPNNFSKRAEVREIKKFGGGKACKTSWHNKKALGISVKGPANCLLRTPVEGIEDHPDHAIRLVGKVGKRTDRQIRDRVYVGAALRASRRSSYELRVFPKGRLWELLKNGEEVAGGRETEIGALGKANKIRFSVTGNTVLARVNGKTLERFKDQDPEQVSGRKVGLVYGSTANRENAEGRGSFDKVRVLVPVPG